MHHAIFKCVIGATSKQRHARLKYASFNATKYMATDAFLRDGWISSRNRVFLVVMVK